MIRPSLHLEGMAIQIEVKNRIAKKARPHFAGNENNLVSFFHNASIVVVVCFCVGERVMNSGTRGCF